MAFCTIAAHEDSPLNMVLQPATFFESRSHGNLNALARNIKETAQNVQSCSVKDSPK